MIKFVTFRSMTQYNAATCYAPHIQTLKDFNSCLFNNKSIKKVQIVSTGQCTQIAIHKINTVNREHPSPLTSFFPSSSFLNSMTLLTILAKKSMDFSGIISTPRKVNNGTSEGNNAEGMENIKYFNYLLDSTIKYMGHDHGGMSRMLQIFFLRY